MIPEIKYRLRYSRRAKRLSLQVVPGEVRVTAPKGVNISAINEFVLSREKWLKKRLACFASITPPVAPVEFTDDSEVSVFGEKMVLQLFETSSEVEFILRNGVLHVYLPERSDLTTVVKRWLDDRLYGHVRGIAEDHSRFGFVPSKIRLGNARTRWGSCSSKGVIMINRRLVHAPLRVVEYVVVHELVHLRHRNHSKKFWGVVDSILGDVKPDKQWLRLQGAHLLQGS